jgi:hypothetical protein
MARATDHAGGRAMAVTCTVQARGPRPTGRPTGTGRPWGPALRHPSRLAAPLAPTADRSRVDAVRFCSLSTRVGAHWQTEPSTSRPGVPARGGLHWCGVHWPGQTPGRCRATGSGGSPVTSVPGAAWGRSCSPSAPHTTDHDVPTLSSLATGAMTPPATNHHHGGQPNGDRCQQASGSHQGGCGQGAGGRVP